MKAAEVAAAAAAAVVAPGIAKPRSIIKSKSFSIPKKVIFQPVGITDLSSDLEDFVANLKGNRHVGNRREYVLSEYTLLGRQFFASVCMMMKKNTSRVPAVNQKHVHQSALIEQNLLSYYSSELN